MPKSPDKLRVEAHLLHEKMAELTQEAARKDWTKKKLAENIILWWLETGRHLAEWKERYP